MQDTEQETAGADEHTYGPDQVDEFRNALIQAGYQCRVYRDEGGELVHHFNCKAPRRPGANVRVDPSVRQPHHPVSSLRAPRQGRAPRQARNARVRGSRRTTGSRTTSSGEDDPPARRRPLEPRYEWRVWAERRSRAFRAFEVGIHYGDPQLDLDLDGGGR